LNVLAAVDPDETTPERKTKRLVVAVRHAIAAAEKAFVVLSRKSAAPTVLMLPVLA
jgi:hypothetical protein